MTGPRGRYLCWSILWSAMADAPQTPVWDRVWAAAHAGDLSGRAGDLAAAVGLVDLAALAAAADELVLVPALADTAAMAMYWQEPDLVDWALRDHRVQDALLPVARAVAQSPAARWWAEPVARGARRYVEWAGAGQGPALLSGANGELAAWRLGDPGGGTVGCPEACGSSGDLERPLVVHPRPFPAGRHHAGAARPRRGRPGPGRGRVRLDEGPVPAGQPASRSEGLRDHRAGRLGAVGRPLSARRHPLPAPRLVARHRLDRDLADPDYTAVAADYDAIHLTVLGYLTTAGRDLPAGDARTMLAGWDPDTTYWLTDCLAPAGPATCWEQLDDHPVRWIRAADG